MSKDSNTQHRATRQHPPTKIIVERHYVGTEKMETVFKRIAGEQITKRVKEIAENSVSEIHQLPFLKRTSHFSFSAITQFSFFPK